MVAPLCPLRVVSALLTTRADSTCSLPRLPLGIRALVSTGFYRYRCGWLPGRPGLHCLYSGFWVVIW